MEEENKRRNGKNEVRKEMKKEEEEWNKKGRVKRGEIKRMCRKE